jgi:hypothetical protein
MMKKAAMPDMCAMVTVNFELRDRLLVVVKGHRRRTAV